LLALLRQTPPGSASGLAGLVSVSKPAGEPGGGVIERIYAAFTAFTILRAIPSLTSTIFGVSD